MRCWESALWVCVWIIVFFTVLCLILFWLRWQKILYNHFMFIPTLWLLCAFFYEWCYLEALDASTPTVTIAHQPVKLRGDATKQAPSSCSGAPKQLQHAGLVVRLYLRWFRHSRSGARTFPTPLSLLKALQIIFLFLFQYEVQCLYRLSCYICKTIPKGLVSVSLV